MAIRFGVGLPGPFFVTAGRSRARRPRRRSPLAGLPWLVFFAILALGLIVHWWYVAVPVLVVLVAVWAFRHRR